MIDPAFPALSKALADSALWRGGAAIVSVMTAAWPSSVAARVTASLRNKVDRSTAAGIIAIGVALCALLQPAIPAYVRPGMPWIIPVAAIAIAALIASSGRAIDDAWPHSRLARLIAGRPHR